MDGFGRLEGREVGKVKLYTIGKMGGGLQFGGRGRGVTANK